MCCCVVIACFVSICLSVHHFNIVCICTCSDLVDIELCFHFCGFETKPDARISIIIRGRFKQFIAEYPVGQFQQFEVYSILFYIV